MPITLSGLPLTEASFVSESDDVLEAMCPIGPTGVISDRVHQYVAAGVDLPVIFLVGPGHSGPEPALQTMRSTAIALALTPDTSAT